MAMGRWAAWFALTLTMLLAPWVRGDALAAVVTYDFSILIVPGAAGGPWAGQTLTGHASYDDTTGTTDGFGTNFPVTDLALTLPSGTVLDESDFPGALFYLPASPYFGFTAFFAADSVIGFPPMPDPLDSSIRTLQFTVNNTGGRDSATST
jgi:hypothetical protein